MSYLEVISTPTIFDSLDITENTKKDYLARLPKFIGWLHQNGMDYDTLLKYKHYLRDRTDLSVASKNKYLAVARIALKELHRRGKLPVDITYNIKSFQQSQKHRVEGLNDEEVSRLCEHLQQLPDNFKSNRLRAIIALLLFQGLRQIEICRLDVGDVDLVSKRLYVLGKGRDDKEQIYLHPDTVKTIRGYLKAYTRSYGSLFTPLTGKSTERLTTRGLRKIVQKALHSAGVHKTVHGFRHYYVTKLIKSYKGDLHRIASYTRHRNLEMLQVYNDGVLVEADLPKYYAIFEFISLS